MSSYSPSLNFNLTKTHSGGAAWTEEASQYFRYRLDRPVMCTLGFRNFVTADDPLAKIVPIKCGDGQRFTQTGIFTATPGRAFQGRDRFGDRWIVYENATEDDFKMAQQTARIKIYYRGFPFSVSHSEIHDFFAWYGAVEYVYMMGTPKTGKTLRSAQGYIIFTKNSDAQKFLDTSKELSYHGCRISCDVFQPKKNKAKKVEGNQKLAGRKGATENPLNHKLNFDSYQTRVEPSSDAYWASSISGTRERRRCQKKVDKLSEAKDNACMPQVFFKTGRERPYLKNLGEIKSNSDGNVNIRFNICAPQTGRINSDRSGLNYVH